MPGERRTSARRFSTRTLKNAKNPKTYRDTAAKRWTQIGNKTDCALLALAHDLGVEYKKVAADHSAANLKPVKLFPFSSARKRAGVLYEVLGSAAGGQKKFRLYMKGASEIVLALCSNKLDAATHTVEPFGREAKKSVVENVIGPFAQQSLRTIALAYKDIELAAGQDSLDMAVVEQTLSEEDAVKLTGQNAETFAMEKDVTFLALVGIEDPLRDTVPGAIRQCNDAGVDVRMVTGDNIDTAIAIGKQCGILRKGLDLEANGEVKDHVAMAGPNFRKAVRTGHCE